MVLGAAVAGALLGHGAGSALTAVAGAAAVANLAQVILELRLRRPAEAPKEQVPASV